MTVLPEYLVCANDDGLLRGVRAVLDLQHDVDPEPAASAVLESQEDDARTLLFRLSDYKRKRHKELEQCNIVYFQGGRTQTCQFHLETMQARAGISQVVATAKFSDWPWTKLNCDAPNGIGMVVYA